MDRKGTVAALLLGEFWSASGSAESWHADNQWLACAEIVSVQSVARKFEVTR